MSTTANGKSGKPAAGGKGGAPKGEKKDSSKGSTAAVGSSSSKNASAKTAASSVNILDEPLVEYATSSKPDRELYNKEQESIKAQIEIKQEQLNKVKGRIADTSGQGPAGEKRKQLRAEQSEIRSKTAGFKEGRSAAFTQIKILQESVSKKIKDMNNAKSKTSYKSVEEIDARIKDLERQIESGTMRLVEEKKALSEITDLRRARKAFDVSDSAQGSIDADKAKIEELKATLDNPEYKALNDRYEAIQKELDELNTELEAGNKNRDALYDERNKIQEAVNVLWSRKKESAGNFKDANDRYYTKANEERQRRIERQQNERRAYEDNKRKEAAERMLEEAQSPAFEREIEDCTNLITYFGRFQSGALSVPEPTLSSAPASVPGSEGIAKVSGLELRKVEDEMPSGAVVMKKKQENDETFFAVSGGKGKKKGGARRGATENGKEKEKEPTSTSSTLNVPFQTVAALLQFDISVPLSRDDVPKTIDALKEKQSWFKENQDRVTKERIAEAEERIRKAEKSSSASAAKNGAEADATADAEESTDVQTNGVETATAGVEKLAVADGETA